MGQKYKHLIPPFIKDLANKNIYNGYIYAGVLFIDIKGFTKITSYLQKYSKEGAEIISDIINEIFSPSVKFVYENNGFISSFAGDAFTALFPNNIDGMLNASILIKNKFSSFQVKTKYGNFIIKTKISLSYGKVNFRILKNKLNTFYFYSNSIKQASTIKHNKHNRILIHKSVMQNMNKKYMTIKKLPHNIFELIEYNKKTNTKIKKYAIKRSIEKQFVLKDIYSINTGEFRDIVSLFININNINHIEELNNIIFDNLEKYGIYYNKIDYGDKGIVIVLLFGAPISHEDQLQNAVDFAIQLKNEFFQKTKSKKIKIGISSGIAYTGFIGSNIQSEYTAIGKSVNLSARLMSNAKYNHIYSDKREVFNIYKCKEIGKIKIKGFSNSIKVYDVLDKENKKILNNTFINRKNEIEYINNIINKKKIVFVFGNAGVGKTALIEQFLKNKQSNYFVFDKNNYSNETFSVFRQIFINYFSQSDFKKQLNIYLNKNKELIKFKDYYEYLLNIKNKKYFINISNENFNNNIGYALSLFIKKLFEKEKTILFFDDIHLLDINSFEIIQNILSKHIKIILSGRKEIKGNIKHDLYEKIIIKGLSKHNTKIIIKSILNHNVHSDIINYVYDISKGNPLIIEKSIKYLKEKKLIGLENNIFIFTKNEKISVNLGSVFLYEYDNLKNSEKEIIKVASVIGDKFSSLVLKSIFKNKDLENILNILVNKNIIKNEKGNFYSFINTLLRDAIYNTILQKHIILYHNKIAKIYENILKTDNYVKLGLKREYLYGIIGYHYEKANKYKKAVKYISLAATYYRDMYFNTEAFYYYNILLKYANKKQKKEILTNTIDILIALGKIDSAINNANILKNTFNDKKYIAIALHKLSLIYGTYKSQYQLALKNAFYSLKLYKETNNKKGIADIYGIIGGIYQALNNNKKAVEFFNKSILMAKRINYSFRLMISMYYIAFTYYNISEYKNALNIINKIEKQIELYNDYENMARVKQLKAWIYNIQGKFKEAEENIVNAIEIATLINNKPLLISLISDKATFEKNKGNFDNAIKLYKECINMEKENNLLSNIDVYYNNIGIMYYFMKKYKKTIDYFTMALNFAEKINDYKRIGIYSGNIGELYMYSGNLKKGIEYLKNAIKYENKANYTRGVGLNSMYLANAYKYNKDYSKASKFYNRAIKYLHNSDKNKIVNVLFEKIDLYIKKNNKLYAIKLIKKCLKESENIDQLIFIRTKILYMYLKNDYKKLLNLSKQYEQINILADIYFYLFLILGNKKFKRMAIKTNNRMLKQHSDYLYIYRKDILTNN